MRELQWPEIKDNLNIKLSKSIDPREISGKILIFIGIIANRHVWIY